MKHYKIAVYQDIGMEEYIPILLAEQKYNECNYHNALKFLDYQFKDREDIIIAIKEIK